MMSSSLLWFCAFFLWGCPVQVVSMSRVSNVTRSSQPQGGHSRSTRVTSEFVNSSGSVPSGPLRVLSLALINRTGPNLNTRQDYPLSGISREMGNFQLQATVSQRQRTRLKTAVSQTTRTHIQASVSQKTQTQFQSPMSQRPQTQLQSPVSQRPQTQLRSQVSQRPQTQLYTTVSRRPQTQLQALTSTWRKTDTRGQGAVASAREGAPNHNGISGTTSKAPDSAYPLSGSDTWDVIAAFLAQNYERRNKEITINRSSVSDGGNQNWKMPVFDMNAQSCPESRSAMFQGLYGLVTGLAWNTSDDTTDYLRRPAEYTPVSYTHLTLPTKLSV